ncbi:Uu.00g144970.m01.CDS01 [Anthostomella pinea]|uniref:Uu.00g144970.m01.CDS01 n=1 Tax=Anthostomella pinea TaxID=933095 RepID=A0AAI8VR18_9PEZI|nr:Uu.00g144970.m01.CDS01 [Anthostomella pinea]
MRLLNVHTFAVESLDDIKRRLADDKKATDVPYVLLSHRWFPTEMTFGDMPAFVANGLRAPPEKARSATKVRGACAQVRAWRHNQKPIDYAWLDTVCINKTDPGETSETINSMYRWYKAATVCFVYLYDHPHDRGPFSSMTDSDWFTRGWTLQELVAPTALEFFYQDWRHLGNRKECSAELSPGTGIARGILEVGGPIGKTSISHRMSWFSDRTTTKGEDEAYCLMGLFGVNMPTLYGEGSQGAFRRLQEEIMKYSDDHSLFAWVDETATDDGTSSSSPGYGLLAPAPHCFKNSGHLQHHDDGRNLTPFSVTNKGLSISLRLF